MRITVLPAPDRSAVSPAPLAPRSGRSPLRPARRRRPTAPNSASSPRAHARSSRCLPPGTSNHPPPLCRPSLNPPSAPSVPTPPLLPLPPGYASVGTRRSTCSRAANVPTATSLPRCAGTRPQPPRRPHLPQIPVQVQLQQITRIVARSSRLRRLGTHKAQLRHVQPPNERLHDSTHVVDWNQFVQGRGKHRRLLPRLTPDIRHKKMPPLPRGHLLIPYQGRLVFRNRLSRPPSLRNLLVVVYSAFTFSACHPLGPLTTSNCTC